MTDLILRKATPNDSLEAIARLIYDTDPFIYPALYGGFTEDFCKLIKACLNDAENLTVISGCRWDAVSNKYMFTINDPAMEGSTPNIYELSYDDLVYKVDLSGARNEITLWYPSVTAKTEFAEKTFLEEVFLEYEYTS